MIKQKVYFKTFGCRTNLFDTQVMINALKDFTQTPYEEESDIVVVNSCTVTNGADSGVRNYINRLQNEGKRIYFTGCGVQTQGRTLLDKGLVSGVFGHSHKEKINTLLKKDSNFFLSDDLESLENEILSDFIGKSRAFIKIQEGCDFACSYCIIPSVRGRARSFPQEKVLKQVEHLAQKGFSEFIITGTNMGSWGKDFGLKIATLVESLCAISTLKRLRIGSLEPSQIDAHFLNALENHKIERHLHIALQHTSPKMLKIMNRCNTFEKDLELFNTLSEKGFALGSDFIVGHPGESEEIWKEAFKNFCKFSLTHLHSFIYSPRDNTPSALLKDRINGNTAKERKRQIEEKVQENNLKFRKALCEKRIPLNVLIEDVALQDSNYVAQGFDEYYNKVQIISKKPILKDSWIKIESFSPKMDKNYAEI
ncbi:tRNA (N(6)-L-threonylcarbamoyladenosine(37)-C(2))-methylthiotransferase MtaB [Helicobacter sp.]|uniref:tRNA (N(6)-L-threonylcarbamoyladenosine(37)-C(2))- methylthiotransferase MtaB n=1 Tax=Helicobacter sp. TaxID=218 RepID=UPI0025B89F0E|nr:tRNA (N(6)-L-threonylcarbamoyladenosine(37)-C(2))-methylthiotransferase MtaB [Helicobacter sp.]MCI5968453.1 tRNA (N(6)-L-threonylcarbamoyladenosine(37)-C(2))-methylthiotransferase MtaB [Helicobacter sp.]MDY2585238.1 tRNA (N(6)-L-threonylcarbamoyladenosine(37)-C(2))-methylthiotransferase MtaB [Helicobacter sp.]